MDAVGDEYCTCCTGGRYHGAAKGNTTYINVLRKDIKVENNTDLKGAVIASEADADKNTLTTGTISFSDIKNEAEYDTKGIGMTLDANKTSGNQPSTVGPKGLIPTVPASVGDSAESTTKSGVSEGKINVTKPEKQ